MGTHTWGYLFTTSLVNFFQTHGFTPTDTDIWLLSYKLPQRMAYIALSLDEFLIVASNRRIIDTGITKLLK